MAIVRFKGSDGLSRGIDATEVTGAQIAPFRKSLFGEPLGSGGICEGEAFEALDVGGACRPDLPVVASFCTAKAFCAWRGKALCAATEWTEACTNGGTTAFATGATPSSSCAHFNLDNVTAAGCRGAAPPFDAIHDLSGNIDEWTDECLPGQGGEVGGGGSSGYTPIRCRVRGGSYLDVAQSEAPSQLDCAADGKPAYAADFAVISSQHGFRCCEPPACLPSQQRPCYTGPISKRSVGLCRSGVATCLADGTGYGACMGEILPIPETCATDGDDDCDGLVNEGGPDCDCAPGAEVPCYSAATATKNVGDCHAGTQICNADGHGYGPCSGAIVPAKETCALPGDESCDGIANEMGGLGCVCVSGSTAPCYEGPANTENVGACRSGTKTCLSTGTGYGTCDGQVWPIAEVCGNDLDDDGDGFADEQGPGQPCPGGLGFAMAYDDAYYSTADALAVDALGRVVVGGKFYTSLSLGGAPLVQTSDGDGYLAVFDSSGTHLWSRKTPDQPVALAPVPGGVVVVAAARHTPKPSGRIFYVSDAGAELWSVDVKAGEGEVRPSSISSTPAGGVVAVFYLTGEVNFVGSWKRTDLLVAAFDSAGVLEWGHVLRGGVLESGARVGVTSTGAVIVGFTVSGDVDFGNGVQRTTGGSEDICIARLTSKGELSTAACFGDALPQVLVDFAVDPAGSVALVGHTYGEVDFGLGPVACPGGPSPCDSFLARFDAAGSCVHSSGGRSLNGVAFRGPGLVLTSRAGFLSLDAASQAVGAFLPQGSFGSPFYQPTPDGAGGVFAIGNLGGSITLDLGNGDLGLNPNFNGGLLARVLLP